MHWAISSLFKVQKVLSTSAVFRQVRFVNMMKAVQVSEFGDVDVLKYSDVNRPKISRDGQVLIRVHCAGVNPVETYIRTGMHKIKPALPYIPGSDGSGVVEQASDEARFKKGDRVYFRSSLSGSYAQYTLVDDVNVFAMNERLSFGQGASLGVPYFTAYRGLVQKCHPKPGQVVLIHGASGAVGVAACQIARVLGLTVYGTAGTDEGMQLALTNGAHKVFNHREHNYQRKIMESTNNKGVDIILEMLANVNLEADLEMAAVRGKVAIIGSRDVTQLTPRYCMTKELSIYGVMMGHATQDDIAEAAAFFKQGQDAGWLQPHVGQHFNLAQAADAHKQVISHSGGSRGKIVLDVD